MDLPSSSKNWDIPSFFPRMPMDIGRRNSASWTAIHPDAGFKSEATGLDRAATPTRRMAAGAEFGIRRMTASVFRWCRAALRGGS
jgi:hypothetical protein